MYDLNWLCESLEQVSPIFAQRGVKKESLESIATLNQQRKKKLMLVEELRHKIKLASQEIGQKKQKNPQEDVSSETQKVHELKSILLQEETQLEEVLKNLGTHLSLLPNLPAEEVPEGNSEEDNKILKVVGTPKNFSFPVKAHDQLGEELGLLDFSAAAKMSGARFAVLKGQLARLERALANFMLDQHLKTNHTEVLVPYLVQEQCLFGTGQLPKFEQDLFKTYPNEEGGKSLYLIPTAEVPVTNLKREELFSFQELPLKYCALTPCFRSEAGSYGRDVKGLIRNHQFHKVELVYITSPEDSAVYHEAMLASATSILELLGLPYRVILLCRGDMGFSAKKCFDVEVWLPSQNKYREISSVSNCGDFQARRANMRYRNTQGKPIYPHTLNGSGLAVGRTLVAILENFQQEDGSVLLPEVLHSYMGGDSLIKKI